MALSWNEIKERAIAFSKKWEDATNEDSEAKPFLIDFFNIFGVSNRRVTSFEHLVEKIDHRDGYIDMLWKGNILIEMKSFGNMPLDGGYLLFTDSEKIEFIGKEPVAEKFFKPIISAKESLNGEKQWCLWLVDASPAELDRAVDAAYRSAPFTSDSSRIELLFDLLTKYNSTLFAKQPK